jgi:hypothetical protein
MLVLIITTVVVRTLVTNEEVLLVAIVALHQFITAVFTLFNDVPTAHEKRMEKKLKRELTPYKRNKSIQYGSPNITLEDIPVLE